MMWDMSDHDCNQSKTMTLTFCPVPIGSCLTMTLTAYPVGSAFYLT